MNFPFLGQPEIRPSVLVVTKSVLIFQPSGRVEQAKGNMILSPVVEFIKDIGGRIVERQVNGNVLI